MDTVWTSMDSESLSTWLNVCSQPSTKCNESPCTNWFGTDNIGQACKSLYDGIPEQQKDVIRRKVCARHINAIECKCVNRHRDPKWKNAKPNQDMRDQCWYLPCTDQQRYFIPRDAMATAAQPCPDQICSAVLSISNAKNVKIDQEKLLVNCKQNQQPKLAAPEWNTGLTSVLTSPQIYGLFLVVLIIFLT